MNHHVMTDFKNGTSYFLVTCKEYTTYTTWSRR